MNLRPLLRRKLAAIKNRLAELAKVDTGEAGRRTYRESELHSERGNLQQELRHVEGKLARPDLARQAARQERAVAIAEAEIANRTANAQRFAERLEKEGDHRQARVWREHALSIPEQTYREHGLLH